MEVVTREISGAIGAIILIVFVLSARHRRRVAPRRPPRDPNADLLAAMQQQNAILIEMLRKQQMSGQAANDNFEEPLLIPEWRPTPDQRARMALDLPLEGPITRAQVKKAYKKAVRTAHPDQGGNAEAFREVRNAFEYFKI